MPIVAELAKEPGLSARDLAALLGKPMPTTLRVLKGLVHGGVIEWRRITTYGREVNGLWLR